MSTREPPLKLLLPLAGQAAEGAGVALPPVLARAASRTGAGGALGLLANVKAVRTWPLARASRSAEAPAAAETAADSRLLALEADDGTTIFIRADALAERVARVRPEALAAGSVDLAALRDPEATSRGLGDWLWKKVTELRVEPDEIGDLARQKLSDWLVDKALGKLDERVAMAASTWGARALMEAIEERLAGEPGLYRWQGGALQPRDLCRAGDARLAGWAGRPALVFVHGTGSHTLGCFGDLPGSEEWRALEAIYEDRIFGLEHRTFSLGPIDNALALAETLPKGATIHLVTHSRGGLVGDLLCLGAYSEEVERLIGEFRREPAPYEAEREAADDGEALRKAREEVSAGERDKLRKLVRLLDRNALKVERYVRVACPAAGTALLSDNLEVFLSILLEVVRRGGAWAAAAVAGPLAGEAFERGLQLLSRVAVEIADKRLEPQLVPGIEAMLPESPMGAFLARAPRRPGVSLAVIAGDSEGGGILKRVVVTFTDWMFFDRVDNDLVVNTDSMYRGIAGRGAHAVFDQGAEVNHHAYFRNRRTRGALRGWLAASEPERLPEFDEVETPLTAPAGLARGETVLPPDNSRPVAILLPDFLGSDLEIDRKEAERAGSGERLWLDPLELPRRGLRRLAIGEPGIRPAGLVDLAYGRLVRHLERTHRVIPFAYDWRLRREQAIEREDGLAAVVGKALQDHPGQPIRLLAHGAGGLLARALFAARPDLWEKIAERDGGRLLMLGVPHHGMHLIVETLLGRSPAIRMLGCIDPRHALQALLDIVGAFPGALELLPGPGFAEGGAAVDFFDAASWPMLAGSNDDRWFGRKLGACPSAEDLLAARKSRDALAAAPPLPHADRIACVHGQAANTPCGVEWRKDAGGEPAGLAMLGSADGDGAVSWASGRLDWLFDERCWLMPVDHAGLVDTPEYFEEIEALLASGSARRLGRLPRSRGEAATARRACQAGPMPGYPGERELAAALFGGRARPRRPKAKAAELKVRVRACDLRGLPIPVLCGHYIGDPIAGAEWVIDRDLVGGALSKRERLGVHAGPRGSASVVLMPRSPEEVLRGTGKGALVVGLGEFGELSARDVRETVRAGVLRLLLHAADRQIEQGCGVGNDAAPLQLRLASVLIGYNSTTAIGVEDSVAAVTLGVAEANRQFAEGADGRPAAQVGTLEFVEQYEDVAITAAHAIHDLPRTQARALAVLGLRLAPEKELIYGDGVRPRLSVRTGGSYWPRLIVTDAERSESGCPPECYDVRLESPIPEEAKAALLAAWGCGKNADGTSATLAAAAPAAASTALSRRYPDKLKYLFLSERARAETVVQQRQPGLIEKLVAAETRKTEHDPGGGFGNTLFQLLVPLGFKSAARETSNLMLVLDASTANLPWEMLVAEGEPMVLGTRVVRQLATRNFRQVVRGTRQRSAYVIYNPLTEGYYSEFGGDRPPVDKDKDRLRDLPGAQAEGEAVAALLEGAGYHVERAHEESRAADVIGGLFRQPYRLLVVAAHGMFEVRDRRGRARSGVVLSDGLMLTAAEVGQMEVVPELVFLSCCHLGKDGPEAGWAPNKLAYSLARELIEIGVRCVVAAGWEVDDEAARTFASTFFESLVVGNETFGEAVFRARKACYERHRDRNTWGAYQAYGDPAFALGARAQRGADEAVPMSPAELVDWLRTRHLEVGRKGTGKGEYAKLTAQVKRRLAAVAADWAARPDVLTALGALHAAFGEEGFAAACAAYRAAIAAASDANAGGSAPLAAVEQLANLEARSAEKLARRGEDNGRRKKANVAEARRRVDRAIERMEKLLALSGDAGAAPPNSERWSILGSACKTMAVVLQEGGRQWDRIKPWLERARDAYGKGEGDPSTPGFNPYGMINRLQLDALLGSGAAGIDESVALCQAAARRRFAENFDFWDAVKVADAGLAGWLAGGDVAAGAADMAAKFAAAYRSEGERLAPQPRQFESVIRQIEFLADMFAASAKTEAAAQTDAALRVDVLRRLAALLREPGGVR